MNFKRITIEGNLAPKRVLIVYGPRRIGKTTMVKNYIKSIDSQSRVMYVVGDDIRIRDLFIQQSQKELLDFVRDIDVLVIDEAQIVPYICLGIKMIIDAMPEKKIILTGSSSFVLSRETGEPLVGRHFQLTLLPLSYKELQMSSWEKKQHLEDLLIYGSYPEVLSSDSKEQKELILNELLSSSLFKDIFILDKIRSPDLLIKILRCLAFQIGKEVSVREIVDTVNADKQTVIRYLDLLEKIFIIKKVGACSSNLRSEIKTKSKYFFYDVGIRNAVISNFNATEKRDDVGDLFENFVFMELYKEELFKNPYFRNIFFWRGKSGLEVDVVIEKNGKLHAYECKWKPKKSSYRVFKELYPDSSIETIHADNVADFIDGEVE